MMGVRIGDAKTVATVSSATTFIVPQSGLGSRGSSDVALSNGTDGLKLKFGGYYILSQSCFDDLS
jgi:hypothetical protein